MINQLDKSLRRMLKESRADAAVLWALRARPTGASVLTSCPADLIPPGTEWPVPDAPDFSIMERDPARLAAVVPTTLRVRLPRPPAAAQSFPLGQDLFMLLVWCDAGASGEISDVLRHLIRNELSYLAQVVEDGRFAQGESDRLLAVLNTLEEGVVSVDPHLGQANANDAAAALLNLPHGRIPVPAFARAMADLAGRALNWEQAAAANHRLQRDPGATVDCTWRFTAPPTHLRVRSQPVREGAFTGRIWTFADESTLSQALDRSERDGALIRATADAMLDPQTVLEIVKDATGGVVDLVYLDANRATTEYLGISRADLVGQSALAHLPNLEGSGLLGRYVRCADTGEPVLLDDFSYFNEILDDDRRYDIRATRVRPGVVNLTWRDVTERFRYARRIAESEEQFRLLAENSGDVVTRIRDERIQWVSPSVEAALGAPPEHWIGRSVLDTVPAEDVPAQIEVGARVAAGESVRTRFRVVGVDGVVHWAHLHIQPFYDRDGAPDGATSSFRIIDDEVAAEQAAADARERQAAADARYRLLMDNSSVAMNVCDNRGRFQIVNQAMCDFFGYDAATLTTKGWEELTAPDYLEIDLAKMHEVLDGRTESYRLTKQYVHADGRLLWGDLSIGCIRDASGAVENFIGQIVDVTAEVDAKRMEDQANARYRRLMDNSPVAMNVCDTNGRFQIVNQAMCDFFGYQAEELMTKQWQQLTAPEYLIEDLNATAELAAGRMEVFRTSKQYLHADGHRIWGDLSVTCVRDRDGNPENFVAQIVDVTAEVAARADLDRARARQAEADARYRRLMANSNIGMTLITPDGRFDIVNQALCDFFGYDEATLRTKTWQEITAADYLDVDLSNVEDILDGRTDSYRLTKQYIHADGHLIWGDLAVSCLRDANGRVERFVSQVTDITAEMESRRQIAQRDQQNRVLARRLQSQTNRMKAELDSAADYVASLLPGELTGAVRVTSTYLPSRELGGDCFGYDWVDDDHLIVYLIDVSGHGIAPALMSVSVLNMLRSNSLPRNVVLDPAALLGELNVRFQMDRQGGNYFTIWYGVYHRPTRALRYASGGHPPALLLSTAGAPELLATSAPPIGMFDTSRFTPAEQRIPAGDRLLIYSDGAFELPLPSGKHGGLDEFIEIVTTQAAAPGWTLDRLTTALLARTAGGQFEDDCSLILLEFD